MNAPTLTLDALDERPAGHPLRALARALWLAAVTLLCAAGAALGQLRRDPRARWAHGQRWTRRWARLATRAIGLRVRVSGSAPPAGALLVPNHVSYLDVLALAEGVGCLFLSKAEVGRWPILGTLLRVGGHATVERGARRSLPEAAAAVAARLSSDRRVAVFLEGTTGPGERVLPFRPSLLQPALEVGAPLVPVALRYRGRDPRLSVAEDVAYWRAEHTLAPHLWRLLGRSGVEVEVVCGEPLRVAPETDRKQLAARLEGEVRALLTPAGGDRWRTRAADAALAASRAPRA